MSEMPDLNRPGGVVPNCRYGHGDLVRVVVNGPANEPRVQFAFVHFWDHRLTFKGEIFTCEKCGYTEFFDETPYLGALWKHQAGQ
jgi:hypothetical protein